MKFNRQSEFHNPQFLPLVLLFSSCIVSAQIPPTTYTIFGHVTLPDGSAASRVTINISSQGGFNRQVISSDAGLYEIDDVPRGRYTLNATNPAAPDQYSDQAEVDLTRFSMARVSADLHLRVGTKVEPARDKSSSGITVAEASQRVPKAAQKEYEKAVKLGQNQQLQRALQSFNRSIELFPEYFQAITQRGHLLVMLGQISEARKDFAHALEINARYEPAMRGAGICKLRESNYSGAVHDLEQAVSNEPRDATAYLFLGFAEAALDRREEARAAFEKALNLDPAGSARAHVYLASLALKENRSQEAAVELEAYLTKVPNAPDAEKLRALLVRLKAKAPRN